MLYKNTLHADFVKRINRFTALVRVNGKEETVHVKNTARMKELLFEGAKVILERAQNPDRKTAYDLVCVYKEGLGLINIDSQAPNKVMYKWLEKQGYELIKPEYTYKSSRFDFYMEKGGKKYFTEVKGCTLERDGIGYFPDAPTERGVKHLYELADAVKQGYECAVAFVIQMPGIKEVKPNIDTHKEFGEALEYAKEKGVAILMLECSVSENNLEIIS